jgi:hypothetical protein
MGELLFVDRLGGRRNLQKDDTAGPRGCHKGLSQGDCHLFPVAVGDMGSSLDRFFRL